MKTRLLFAATACCAVAFCFPFANPTAAHEREQHPPLEHGNVTINAALDGNQLVIEITSPAVNVALLDKLRDVTEARLNIVTPRGQQTQLAANGRAHITLQ